MREAIRFVDQTRSDQFALLSIFLFSLFFFFVYRSRSIANSTRRLHTTRIPRSSVEIYREIIRAKRRNKRSKFRMTARYLSVVYDCLRSPPVFPSRDSFMPSLRRRSPGHYTRLFCVSTVRTCTLHTRSRMMKRAAHFPCMHNPRSRRERKKERESITLCSVPLDIQISHRRFVFPGRKI